MEHAIDNNRKNSTVASDTIHLASLKIEYPQLCQCSVNELEELGQEEQQQERQQLQQCHDRNARLNGRPSPRSRAKRRGHRYGGGHRPRSPSPVAVEEEEDQRRYQVSFEPGTNIVE